MKSFLLFSLTAVLEIAGCYAFWVWLRSSRSPLWPFLKPGAFHLQQVQTVSTIKLERRLGSLNSEEMKRLLTAPNNRLGLGNLKQR